MKAIGLLIAIVCFFSSVAFAAMCPTVKQVAQDFNRLQTHQYVKVHHHGVIWEAMKDHKASTLGIYFDYAHINHDAPKHSGVSCFYSSNHGDDITFVYRREGNFKPATSHWKDTVSGGPMCGDYHKTIMNSKGCAFQ